jgi:hypothetical protein
MIWQTNFFPLYRRQSIDQALIILWEGCWLNNDILHPIYEWLRNNICLGFIIFLQFFPATNEAHASGKSPSFKYTWNVLQIYLQIIRPASSEVLQTSMIHNNHTSNEAPGTSSILFLTHTCFSRSPGNFCWKCQGLCWCFVNINK